MKTLDEVLDARSEDMTAKYIPSMEEAAKNDRVDALLEKHVFAVIRLIRPGLRTMSIEEMECFRLVAHTCFVLGLQIGMAMEREE